MIPDHLVGGVCLVLWFVVRVGDSVSEHLPLTVRRWLGEVDLDDPQTVEEIQLAYTEDRLSESEMERRLDLAVDPRTEQIRNAVEPVSGIGPETALNIAAEFESEHELREASRTDLQKVPNVGPERAEALRDRL